MLVRRSSRLRRSCCHRGCQSPSPAPVCSSGSPRRWAAPALPAAVRIVAAGRSTRPTAPPPGGAVLRRRQLLGAVQRGRRTRSNGSTRTRSSDARSPWRRRRARQRGARHGRARAVRSHRGGRGDERAARSVGPGQATGRFVKACRRRILGRSRTASRRRSTSSRQEAVGATFALLVDSSESMSRRMDFVQRTAATLAGYMTPLDRMLVAPFSKDARRGHRADQRSRRPSSRRSRRSVRRRHRDPRLARAGCRRSWRRRRAARDRADHGRLRRAQRDARSTRRSPRSSRRGRRCTSSASAASPASRSRASGSCAACRRDRRPVLLPVARRAARRSARRAHRGRPEPLSADVHAEEPEDRRHVADRSASRRTTPTMSSATRAGLLRAEAAAYPARRSNSRRPTRAVSTSI